MSNKCYFIEVAIVANIRQFVRRSQCFIFKGGEGDRGKVIGLVLVVVDICMYVPKKIVI